MSRSRITIYLQLYPDPIEAPWTDLGVKMVPDYYTAKEIEEMIEKWRMSAKIRGEQCRVFAWSRDGQNWNYV